MKHKIRVLFAALLLLAMASQAQLVRVLYEVVPNGENHTVKVYLQSTSEQEVALRAVNLSAAVPASVTVKAVEQAAFVESWTDYLEESRSQKELTLSYDGMDLSQRFQYGNADPGLPATHALIVPSNQDEPLLVMEMQLAGQGSAMAYLEHESENPLNQLGCKNLKPVSYVIEHPKREGPVSEGNPALQKGMVLYPNPAKDRVSLRMTGPWEGEYHYTVSDVLGRILFEANVPQDLVGKEISLDLNNWAEGTYFVNLISASGESMTRKLVKD